MQNSLLIPTVPSKIEEIIPFANHIVSGGTLERLWQGQSHRLDPIATFTALAGAGHPVPTGVCVAVMPLRHPYQAALEARTLAAISGYSPIYGIGPGSAVVQEALLGQSYAQPLRAVREYVTLMRQALMLQAPSNFYTENPNRDQRDTRSIFHLQGALPYIESPPVRIGLGVLRPRMAQLAGEIADAAITWLTPATYLNDIIIPAVENAADKAERPRPRVVTMVPVAVRRPGRDPVQLVHEVAGGHFQLPHYADLLHKAGVSVASNDPSDMARSFLAADGFLYGSPEEIVAGLSCYEAAGVDEVVLTLSGPYEVHGLADALKDIEEIVAVLSLSQ